MWQLRSGTLSFSFSPRLKSAHLVCVLCVTFLVASWKWDYKQRVVIQVLVKPDEKPSEILRKLQVMYEDKCISKTRVYEWVKRFKEGCESVEGDPREAAPVTSSTDANFDCLYKMFTSDPYLSIRALSDDLNINKKTVPRSYTKLVSKVSHSWTKRNVVSHSERRQILDELGNHWR